MARLSLGLKGKTKTPDSLLIYLLIWQSYNMQNTPLTIHNNL